MATIQVSIENLFSVPWNYKILDSPIEFKVLHFLIKWEACLYNYTLLWKIFWNPFSWEKTWFVFSSQTEANQFTGMVYQGLLLSDRRRLRTESIEEHATPNSAPAQWPGETKLRVLLAPLNQLHIWNVISLPCNTMDEMADDQKWRSVSASVLELIKAFNFFTYQNK